jgi:hypothetical protein
VNERILGRFRQAPEPTLPEGFDVEPSGWRDMHGRSPIDAFNSYLADRFRFDVWAIAESRRMSTHDIGGQMTDDDKLIRQAVRTELNRIRERQLTPQASAAAVGGSYGWPSEHDPKRNRIVGIRRVRAGQVEITARYSMPGLRALPRELTTHDYRYDFVNAAGEWRLKNRLAILTGRRPIGGLY